VGSMTTRGRVLVVAAFVLAAALCATAAVALVLASNDSPKPAAALPTVHPTLVYPTDQPTTAPSTPAPTKAPTTAATASSSPGATSSPRTSPAARATSGGPAPTRTPLPAGLAANASVAEASGATAGEGIHVKAHATDGDGSISLLSLDWGDGSEQVRGGRGTACTPPAKAPADCRNFAWTHAYPDPGTYTITLWFVSGMERSRLLLPVTIG
jgi:hypothetical protein